MSSFSGELVTIRTVLAGVVALCVAALVVVVLAARDDSGGDEARATFGDRMQPYAGPPADGVTAEHREDRPDWGRTVAARWNVPGAFTYSLVPQRIGAFAKGRKREVLRTRFDAAQFHAGSEVAKGADVTFTFTGRRFAIRYLTFVRSDAMVWVDGRAVAARPFTRAAPGGAGVPDWIEVTLPETRTVEVRFAGPPHFAGVEMPAAERGVVRATRPRFTLGVVSDSFYEPSPDPGSMSSSAAPTLTTLTGFRVWNLAQGGSGYLNTGSDPLGRTFADLAGTSPYGSESRIEAIGRAPLDALLVNGSINDADFGVAEHRAAVDDFLTAVENQAPTLPIVVVGLEPISTARIPDGPTGKLAAMNENLRELAKQHRNVVGFIDPYTPNWFTGTGSTRNPTGEGNQDRYIGVDGVHPNGAGQAFYQRKVVAELARLPVDPLSRAR